jgi:outer membrane protein assembly factor BamB
MKRSSQTLLLTGALLVGVLPSFAATGWLHFRGPQQNGTSLETGLPEKLSLTDGSLRWTAPLAGQSTAVVADGRVFIMGYAGEGPDLQEVLACFDAETGRQIWERRFNDFMSDIIYTRYSTSNPTIDPETGNVYMQGSQGIIACFTRDGEPVWQHSMMEKFGRMTFPNGRTTTPVIDDDLVITHGITANWGADGPAGNRFYAFDKKSGELVWASTPGARPKDSSYTPPTLAWWNGKRVIYSGTGDGSIVCLNARDGVPLWRVQITAGGINTQVLIHNNDKLIAIHGAENLDTSERGRMVAVRIPQTLPAPPAPGQPVEFNIEEVEVWRNPLAAFSSSPIIVGDRVYTVTETGELCAVNAATGQIFWREKIGIEQRNSSLVHAEGRLYVPMLDDPEAKGSEAGTRGAFYIFKPSDSGLEKLTHLSLEGRFFGSPAIYNGKIYVQTTRQLYCFGKAGNNPGVAKTPEPVKWPTPGPAVKLQVIPAEVLLLPGDKENFRIRKLDANGFTVEEVKDVSKATWASYIPPTARVRSQLDAKFDANGALVAGPAAKPSAGAFEVTVDGLKGYIRGRILPGLPYTENFESYAIDQEHPAEHLNAGQKFAFPPLPWIGARFKFEIHEIDDTKALAKTIDNKLFQRASVFLGTDTAKNYTIEADVMTDGNRRRMSEVGLINQRYIIILKGNAQQLEVNSNLERIRATVPFAIQPKTWYRLKARVDVAADGSGVVRAKAWKRGEAEPAGWSIEVPHKTAHTSGSPGLFSFSPQDVRAYLDNVTITQN